MSLTVYAHNLYKQYAKAKAERTVACIYTSTVYPKSSRTMRQHFTESKLLAGLPPPALVYSDDRTVVDVRSCVHYTFFEITRHLCMYVEHVLGRDGPNFGGTGMVKKTKTEARLTVAPYGFAQPIFYYADIFEYNFPDVPYRYGYLT